MSTMTDLLNPENVPDPTPASINDPPVLNWKTDYIVCPRTAVILQNSFASFGNY